MCIITPNLTTPIAAACGLRQNQEHKMALQHPEQKPNEVYLGNFTPEQAEAIGWRSKRAGTTPLRADGTPYPFAADHNIRPWFASRNEVSPT